MNQRDIASVIVGGNRINLRPSIPFTDIAGKSYYLISSKGLSDGSSDKLNDGADFGPDTPGTQTSGIQEALNAAGNAIKVKVAFGNYKLNSNLQFNDQNVEFEGGTLVFASTPSALNFSYCNGAIVKGNGVVISGWTNQAISLYQSGYFECTDFICNGASSPGTNGNAGIVINGCPNGAFVARIKLSNCGNISISQPSLNFATSSGQINSNVWFVDVTVNGGVGPFIGTASNCYFIGCSSSGTAEDTFDIADGSYNIFVSELHTANSGSYGITIGATVSTGICKNIFLNNCSFITSKGGGCSIGFGVGTDEQIFLTNCDASDNGQAANANQWDNSGFVISSTINSFSLVNCSTNNTGTTQTYGVYNLSEVVGLKGSAINCDFTTNKTAAYFNTTAKCNVKFINCNGINYQGYSVTTPAVPASAAVYVSTFPFSIRITILTASGATATITDANSTVSSSFALSAGQQITLDPGCSITPTYTTLTWQFYGE